MPRLARVGSSRTAAVQFAVCYAFVGALLATWALGIGRYGGPDEPAHVLRSFAAAHGDVLGDSADPLPPGYRVVSVPAALASGDPSCYRHDARLASACAMPDIGVFAAVDDSQRVRVATSAGLTPPLYHLTIGTIVRLVGDPADTAWYRLVAALVHAVVVSLALVRARSRPGLVLTVAAITPATWFLLGVVNPNSLEIALALLAWVGVARCVDTGAAAPVPTTADAWWIAAPLALAIAIRPIAVVAAIAMVLVIEIRGRPGRSSRLRWIVVVPSVVATLAVVGWQLGVDVQLDDPRTAVHRSVWSSVSDAVGSLPRTAIEAIDSLGWNEFRAPMPASIAWAGIWVTLLVATVVSARRRRAHRELVAMGGWFAVLVATPVVFETIMAGSVGPIWQGRYSLPVLMGLVAVVAVPVRRAGATRALVVLLAAIEVGTYWSAVRRYTVGSDGSWWLTDGFRSSAWLAPGTWLIVHVAIVIVAAILVVRSSRPADEVSQTM